MTDSIASPLRCGLLASGAIATLYLGTLVVYRRQLVADGYDGIGFVLSLSTFDLARFAPQPPGFPLLVGAGRLLAWLGLPPALALATVSALLLSAGLGALCGLVFAVHGGFAALLFGLSAPLGPLAYGLGLSTLSDAPGLGLLLLGAVLAVAVLAGRGGRLGHLAVGGAFGICLGVRPPLLPLLLWTLVVLYGGLGGSRRPALAALPALLLGLLAGVLAWLGPLGYLVGPRTLLAASLGQAQGHFADFGGSLLADPAPGRRLLQLVTGVLAGSGGPLGALLLPLIGLRLCRGWPAGDRLARPLLWLGGGAALWVLLALPLGGAGRHLLPLAVLLPLGLCGGVAALGHSRGQRLAMCGLVLLCGLASSRTVWAYRRSLPPGAALAAALVGAGDGRRLYGTRAARYLDLYRGSGTAHPALYLGEVVAELERQSNLPAEVLLTSEVQAAPSAQPRLRPLYHYCYPASVPLLLRWDRQPSGAGSCVDLVAYRVHP